MLYSKTIGKSKYIIEKTGGAFCIREIYNGSAVAFDSRRFSTMDEARHVLDHISRERVYTDPFYSAFPTA